MSLQDDLRELYLLDQQVRGLSSRLDSSTRHFKSQQERQAQTTTQRNELTLQLKQNQAHVANLEGQTRDLSERIEKHRQAMARVTNNKEYSALLIEMNTLKVEKGKLEDETLKHMTRVEEQQAQLAGLETELAERAKLVAVAHKEVEQRRAEVSEELAKVTKQRDEAATKLPPDVWMNFKRLANQHDGEAMAEVIEENARLLEYTCGGCYMQIPIERLSALISQPSAISACPSCGRLLYVGSELRENLSNRAAKSRS